MFIVIVAGASRTCCLVVPCGGRGGVGSPLASWVRSNETTNDDIVVHHLVATSLTAMWHLGGSHRLW
jgi:hypothetical protein